MRAIGRAVVVGLVVAMVGTIPRNVLFGLNVRYMTGIPWAVPIVAVYMWIFWRFLTKLDTAAAAGEGSGTFWSGTLRANRVSPRLWGWSLVAGALGIVALVLALRVLARFVVLPDQQLPDWSHVPVPTIVALLVAAAPVAGIIEEAAFRGFMQRPIEREAGIAVAIAVTWIMFAVAHLDFTPVLLPYYVAVAAIYGLVTHLTDSILPAIVLHTGGNLYSNFDLWVHGRAEWQSAPPSAVLGASAAGGVSLQGLLVALAILLVASVLAYIKLARVSRAAGSPGHGFTLSRTAESTN
jgi:membrane protease YdiL (CAAX protease family)